MLVGVANQSFGGAGLSRRAIHRLGKALNVRTLVEHPATDVFVSWNLFRVLAGIPPKTQGINGNAQDFGGLARVQVFVHAASFYQKNQRFGYQSGLIPDLSIYVKCLENRRQGASFIFIKVCQ